MGKNIRKNEALKADHSFPTLDFLNLISDVFLIYLHN